MKISTGRLAALLGIGVGLTYLSLTPGVFYSMGYVLEEITAARAILAKLGLESAVEDTFAWPRHGLLGLVAHMPFLILGRLLEEFTGITQELVVALEPIILTTLLVVVVFLWSVRLTGERSRALSLALIAAFCTMIWPYAYIGLELQQSLFLLLAAWLAIGRDPGLRWRDVLFFAFCCGMAVSVKSTALFLVPAVAFLLLHFFAKNRPGRALQLAAAVGLVIGMLGLNAWTRSGYWNAGGGTRGFLDEWMVVDALAWALNGIALLGAPGKGLIVYAPVALIAASRIPLAWEVRRDIVIFAILTLAGLVSGFALFDIWSEETWGPRYLHSAIAPLLMIVAASPLSPKATLLDRAPLFVTACLGFIISFLGAIYSYGAVHLVALDAGRSTLETIQTDPAWNHVKFNARLLRVWVTTPGDHHAVWTPGPTWYYEKPEWAAEPKALYLTGYSTPQPMLVRRWGESSNALWILLVASSIAGPGLIIYAAVRAKDANHESLPSNE